MNVNTYMINNMFNNSIKGYEGNSYSGLVINNESNSCSNRKVKNCLVHSSVYTVTPTEFDEPHSVNRNKLSKTHKAKQTNCKSTTATYTAKITDKKSLSSGNSKPQTTHI